MMRRITLTALIGVVAVATCLAGCLDRKPAPVCPVPIEIASTKVTAGAFDGVDLLVVVDNSGSMAEEQKILSTGFFTLVNSLTRPILSRWDHPAVENMRVAVVSSDMGLQFGEDRANSAAAGDVDSCEKPKGDDGAFLPTPVEVTTISVQSNVIACEEGGGQCPDNFTCNITTPGEPGVCVSNDPGSSTVNCSSIGQPSANNPNPPLYAETVSTNSNDQLTVQVACLAQQGTKGCGVEQQLEAAVRGLETNGGFLVDTHLLAVLVVSDEEDCSIEQEGLFNTAEWQSGPQEHLNIACNYPEANEEFLFKTSRYKDKLVELKNMQTEAVIFAAIVGVPRPSDGADSDPVCQGSGTEIAQCLEHARMQIALGTFKTAEGYQYTHFEPACERKDPDTQEDITSARPGRRYVEVASQFGDNAYVYSICNPDWSPAMEKIADIIARQISATCYPKKLDWDEVSQQEKNKLGCPNCGKAQCDVVVQIELKDGEAEKCPEELYQGIDAAEKQAYMNRKEIVIEEDKGSVRRRKIRCPLPKLAAPRNCESEDGVQGASDWVSEKYAGMVGWYYCENSGENFKNACADGLDNDNDGKVDGNDEECFDCVEGEGGNINNCDQGKCSYGVEITPEGKDVTTGHMIEVECMQQFSFTDTNCQEDSKFACNNGKDDDGNGIWDCNDSAEGEEFHLADPHCCPMTADQNKICQPNVKAIQTNCGKSVDYKLLGACQAQMDILGCSWAQ